MAFLRLASTTGRLAAVLTVSVASGTTAPIALGGNTWDGGGANNNWTTGQNWNPASGAFQLPPFNNGLADIVMAGATRLTPLVDVPYSIRSLTFDNTAGAFVILGAEELTIGAGGITNNDAQLQSVIGPVKLSADQIWTAAAGRLQSDAITLNGFDLGLTGAHPIDLPNIILGTGDVTVADSYTSTVTMLGPGANTYVGHTDVQSGTLMLQKGGVAVPGDLTIGSGGTVRLAGNEQIAESPGNEVVVLGGGLLDVNSRTETLTKLTINGGSATVAASGKLTAAEALVTGATALWTSAGDLHIGDAGAGTLSILAGGKVNNVASTIGNQPGAAGGVTVDGIGSKWTSTGTLYVANAGAGTLDVASGGALETAASYVGDDGGSLGTVTVNGSGSTWFNHGLLYIGNAGQGALHVTGGGNVRCAGDVTVGLAPLSVGEVTVSGANSSFSTTFFDVGWPDIPAFLATSDLRFGAGETTLSVTNGGLVAFGNLELNQTPVLVDGPGSKLAASATLIMPDRFNEFTWYLDNGNLSGGGVIEVKNGGQITSRGTTIAQASVSGPGSTWKMGFLNLPPSGFLSVANGGSVQLSSGNFGNGSASINGVVDIAGAGTSLDVFGLRPQGNGTVTVSGGASVTAGSVRIAAQIGGASSMTVDGAGSRLETSPRIIQNTFVPGMLVVGDRGVGSLAVTHGAVVRTSCADLSHLSLVHGVIGNESGAVGSITLDQSTWLITNRLDIGLSGSGELDIINGSDVDQVPEYVSQSFIGYIGVNAGSNGALRVDGIGSTWTSDELHVGGAGAGELTVSNGGRVDAPLVTVGALGEVNGNGNLVGHVHNGGVVSPGISVGTLEIDGDYTQLAEGELAIELASGASFDSLDVSADVLLGGTLTVTLAGGFTPSVGQSFSIISADQVDDTFSAESLPSSPGVDFELVYTPTSVVIQVVAAYTADFDKDGDVDANDLTQWKSDFGVNALSDADQDNDSDGADFLAWQQQLGSGAPADALSRQVPEPGSMSLALIFFAASGWFQANRGACKQI